MSDKPESREEVVARLYGKWFNADNMQVTDFGEQCYDAGAASQAQRVAELESQLLAWQELKAGTERPLEEAKGLLRQGACIHEHVGSGSEHLICADCGFEWDYRKMTGHDTWRKRAENLLGR